MQKSILIVDDDAAIRRLLGVMLQRQSFETDEASNGLEAMERIRQRRYDAIVLDLMMGPGSGFDVLDQLKDLRSDRCVVVLSASSERTIRDADGPNVFAQIRKPFDVSQLLDRINECSQA